MHARLLKFYVYGASSGSSGDSSDVKNTIPVLPTESGRSRRETERLQRGREREIAGIERMRNRETAKTKQRSVSAVLLVADILFLNTIKCVLRRPCGVEENFKTRKFEDGS